MMSLRRLLAGIVAESATLPDVMINDLTLDNRQIKPGMAFVAVKGTQQHGLTFAPAAMAAGAVAVLFEPDAALVLPDLSAVIAIPIPNLRTQLGAIADRFHAMPSADLFMVGVTGTDGKTSVTHFVAEALNARLANAQTASTGVIGTIGIGCPGQLRTATHTTPDALTVHGVLNDLQRQGLQSVAMEVSSHALDQGRVNNIRFDVAVLTNLTRDHLDYHGTVAAYADAKRRLFQWEGLQAVVLNVDDPFGRELAAEVTARSPGVQVIGYGVGQAADYPTNTLVATSAVFDYSGIRAEVFSPWGTGTLQAPVLGQFNLHNLLATLGVLVAKGLPFAEALTRLQHVWVVPGRMERVAAGQDNGKLVVVDYAHTPGALTQVLKAVRVHTQGKLICVFGCGGDRDRGKRPLMAAATEAAADVVIVTDDNPRTESPVQIFADIQVGFSQPERITFEHDRAAAIRLAVAQAQAGDTVLIAGKGHETVQMVADKILPFDDREQAALALQECAA